MNDYVNLAKEFNNNRNDISNVVGIGEVKSLNPISIFLSDITLDQDDLILSDKITKLIEPIIPDIICNTTCSGDCDCTVEAKINEEIYNEDKLKVGDKVLLQGIEDGQKYIIVDRVNL